MALDNTVINIIVNKLKGELEGGFFDHPYNLTNNQFALPYHGSTNLENKGRGTFIACMDPNNPFICFSYDKFTKYNDGGAFSNILKRIAGTKILEVNKISFERIVVIHSININPTIDTTITEFDLVFELFPQRPNIILLNHDTRKVIAAYKEHGDILSNSFLLRNAKYDLPSPRTLPDEVTSIEQLYPFFSKSIINVLKELEKKQGLSKALNLVLNSNSLFITEKGISPISLSNKESRIEVKDIYKHFYNDQKKLAFDLKEKKLFSLLTEQLKIAKRKKNNLQRDFDNNTKKLVFKDYGQVLYLYQTEYDGSQNVVNKDGYSIPVDKDVNYVTNANRYFVKYRKAKNSLPILQDLMATTDDEIEYLEKKLLDLYNGSPRDILELKIELEETGYIKSKKKISSNKKKKRFEPHYIILEQGKIGFGQNDLQNETLTFEIAKIHDLFFHVKDHPGAHVVLFGQVENKSYQELAAELALYLSHLDSGDVYVTEIKNVKKNRNKKGLVNLMSYKTITIKKIKESSLALFKKDE